MPCHKQADSYLVVSKTYLCSWFSKGDLVDNLMEQIKQFELGFTLGERAETIENKKMVRLS
jgi:hypothetical protein